MTSDDEDQPGSQLQPHVLETMIENQKRELELRAGELTLRAQEDEHSFKHAEKMLEAQERDRASQRVYRLKSAKHLYWFVGALVLMVITFLAVLALMGKEQMAMEIFKAAAYLVTGVTGGVFYGKAKSHPTPSRKPNVVEAEDSDSD